MYNVLAVAFGGAFGALLRFGVYSVTERHIGKDFPYGTLTVNVIGGFLVGLLSLLLIAANEHFISPDSQGSSMNYHTRATYLHDATIAPAGT